MGNKSKMLRSGQDPLEAHHTRPTRGAFNFDKWDTRILRKGRKIKAGLFGKLLMTAFAMKRLGNKKEQA